ncbi:hypothetical protein Ahy_B02g058994 [Arachis hypogaea]|uniref:Uncharacterized protein n=1 Tax=Arachis hypogaea TaxID=3818 RepID=A0A445AFY0_ARAHY|nr:hypothetical protein Ahy_B02g058994 [Arachis hypogaea]
MGYYSHSMSDSYYCEWRNYPNCGWQSQNQRNFSAPCSNYQEPPSPYSYREPLSPYSSQEPPPLYPYQEPSSFYPYQEPLSPYSYQEPSSFYSYQESSSPSYSYQEPPSPYSYQVPSDLELLMKEFIHDIKTSVKNVEKHVQSIIKSQEEEQANSFPRDIIQDPIEESEKINQRSLYSNELENCPPSHMEEEEDAKIKEEDAQTKEVVRDENNYENLYSNEVETGIERYTLTITQHPNFEIKEVKETKESTEKGIVTKKPKKISMKKRRSEKNNPTSTPTSKGLITSILDCIMGLEHKFWKEQPPLYYNEPNPPHYAYPNQGYDGSHLDYAPPPPYTYVPYPKHNPQSPYFQIPHQYQQPHSYIPPLNTCQHESPPTYTTFLPNYES